MYQEKRENFNWLKIFLRVLIAFSILLLSIKLISIIVSNREFNKKNTTMEDNLKVVDKLAKEYFTKSKLPKKTGENVKVSLDEIIDEKLSDDIVDAEGKKCNYKESFIKATKLDTEYQIQSSLTCGSETNYTNSFIPIDSNITIKPTTKKTTTKSTTTLTITSPITSSTSKTTTTTTTTSSTTTKPTTTVTTTRPITTTTKPTTTKPVFSPGQNKKFTISFNSNGGSAVANQTIKYGSYAKEIIPKRKGYKFAGWYYHGEKFKFNKKIDKDYVLTAKWSKE